MLSPLLQQTLCSVPCLDSLCGPELLVAKCEALPKPIDLSDDDIIGPHDYNRDDLSPKDFLLAVMRDRRVPLAARMDAAAKVAVFEHPRLAQVSQDVTSGVTIRIEGGLPPLPGTNIIMPGEVPNPSGFGEPPTLHKKGNGSDHDP